MEREWKNLQSKQGPIKSILISGQVSKKLSVDVSRTNQFAHDYSGKVLFDFPRGGSLMDYTGIYAYEVEKKNI